MKKTFYSILLALILGVFTAQAQITQSDMPTIGSSYTYNIDTNAAFVAPGPSGTGQTWSFSFPTANADSTLVEKYVDPSTTPNASDFPNATIAVQINNKNAYGYARATSSMIEDLGMVGEFIEGAPAPLPPTSFMPDGLLRMTFPANVGSQFSDYGYVAITWQNVNVGIAILDPVDEVRIRFHVWKEVNVDGSGDLTINGKTWTNVIRYRVKEIIRDTAWVDKAPLFNNFLAQAGYDSTVTYRWYSKTLKNDVLRIQYNGTEDTLQAVEVTTSLPVGIITLAEAGVTIYPNPAKDFLKINDTKRIVQSVAVKNLLGQDIETSYSNGILNVASLPKGMYILEITTIEGNKITSKFIKE